MSCPALSISRRINHLYRSLLSSMTNCPLFLLLPELSKDIISQFLSVRDVVHLESSILSGSQRPALVSLLTGIHLQESIKCRDRDFRRLWEWKIKHEIVVERLICGQQYRIGSWGFDQPWTPKPPVVSIQCMEMWLSEHLPRVAHNLLELQLVLDDFSDSLIGVIASNCTLLHRIHFVKQSRLRDENTPNPPSMAPIARRCQALKRLFLGGAMFLDQEAAQCISTDLERMQLLDIQYSHEALHTLISRCHKLTKLTLYGRRIGPAVLPETYELIREHLPDIRSLTLYGRGAYFHNVGALSGCAHLNAVEYSPCDGLNVAQLEGLLSIPALQSLNLSQCSTFDFVMHESQVQQSQIMHLSLFQIESITDEGLASILARCPLLQGLSVFGAPLLTINTVDSVVKHCRSMRKISFAACATELKSDAVIARLASLGSAIECDGRD